MRRTSFLALLCALTAPACSAITDFGFTFSDGGAVDATTGDSGSHVDAGDAGHPDGSTDEGVVADGDVDAGVDGGMTCPTACDDGDPCNGVETCDTTMGACVTGTPVACPPSDPCHMAGTCDMATGGCVPGALIDMDDGDPCNGVETCVVVGTTASVSHSGPRCDDGVDCTRDTCDSATGGCTNMPNDGSCTTSTDICRVTAPPMCTTTACTRASDCAAPASLCYAGFCCAPATGMCLTVACTTDAGCSDGQACNGDETCDLTTHTCASGAPIDCSDSLGCSVDACVNGAGGAHTCRHTPGDGDGDGYLDRTCIAGLGDDCNDADPTVHPLATDTCNGVDDDCNGTSDDIYRSGPSGLGAPCSAGVGVCTGSGTYVCAMSHLATVCNAMAGAPTGPELCGNGLDDNCNGMTDEGYTVGASCTVGTGACLAMGALVCSADRLSTVCNTGAGSPGNELCGNGIDDDCDMLVDEGFEMRGTTCTVGIGACARNGVLDCSADRLSLQCTAMQGSPSTETCNGIDDDCDGVIDNGPTLTWYRDADGDGYGDTSGSGTSTFFGFCPPMGYVMRGGDCNDANNAMNPGHAEVCGNSLDDDCNGLVDDCPPPNDNCAMSHPLGMMNPGASGSTTQSFAYATVESADCVSGAGGHGTGPEVWYSFDVATGRPPFVLYFDTFGSDFDTMISIRNGCGASPIGCEDDTPCGSDGLRSHFAFIVPNVSTAAAGHFIVAVHAFSVPGTTVVLNWQGLPGATGTMLPLNTAAGATVTHTLPPGTMSLDASMLCPPTTNGATGVHGEDMYYVMGCPGVPHTLRVDTCLTAPAFNSVLYMRAGGGMSGNDLVCNDDDASCSSAGLSAAATSFTGAGIWGVYVDGGPSAPPASTYTLRTLSY